MQTSVQILLAVELVAVLLVATLLPFRVTRALVWAEVVLLAALCGTWAVARSTASDRRVASMRELEANAPHLGREDEGFLSSVKCRACHPTQYATWYASFHRTMTQVATPETVVGNFEDVTLESRNRTYSPGASRERVLGQASGSRLGTAAPPPGGRPGSRSGSPDGRAAHRDDDRSASRMKGTGWPTATATVQVKISRRRVSSFDRPSTTIPRGCGSCWRATRAPS